MKTQLSFTTKILLWSILIISKGNIYSQSNFVNGSLISTNNATTKDVFQLSSKSYDENMVGVFYKDTAMSQSNTPSKKIPLLSSGIIYIRYNSENGVIKKGDTMTSSSTPGEAMRATKSGVIIGFALEDAPSASGLIRSRIMIQYVK